MSWRVATGFTPGLDDCFSEIMVNFHIKLQHIESCIYYDEFMPKFTCIT